MQRCLAANYCILLFLVQTLAIDEYKLPYVDCKSVGYLGSLGRPNHHRDRRRYLEISTYWAEYSAATICARLGSGSWFCWVPSLFVSPFTNGGRSSRASTRSANATFTASWSWWEALASRPFTSSAMQNCWKRRAAPADVDHTFLISDKWNEGNCTSSMQC